MANHNVDGIVQDTAVSVAQLKAVLELNPDQKKWYDPVYLLDAYAEHITRVIEHASDPVAFREAMTFIARVRDARENNESDIAQALFLLFGLSLARASLSQAWTRKAGDPFTFHGFIQHHLALSTANENRTKPATEAKVANGLRVQQHIEQIDRELGVRDKKKEKKNQRIATIRNRIVAMPLELRPEYMKKTPSPWTIRQHVK